MPLAPRSVDAPEAAFTGLSRTVLRGPAVCAASEPGDIVAAFARPAREPPMPIVALSTALTVAWVLLALAGVALVLFLGGLVATWR